MVRIAWFNTYLNRHLGQDFSSEQGAVRFAKRISQNEAVSEVAIQTENGIQTFARNAEGQWGNDLASISA